MKELHKFLVPDYYPEFSCKMGKCRHACCEGWPISFSRQDYFNLLGANCSPQLRAKLDCGMHLTDYPTAEEYAQITPKFDGNCPMRLKDGRCGLQAELGEEALALVCVLYPRGVRTNNGCYECSCSNSCESVPELLLEHEGPIAFKTIPLKITVPPELEHDEPGEMTKLKQNLRLWFISLLQNRKYSLPRRFFLLYKGMNKAEKALKSGNTEEPNDIISEKAALSEPPEFNCNNDELLSVLNEEKPILEYIVEHSESIRPYGEAIFSCIKDSNKAVIDYFKGKEKFESTLPNWEIWFENLLINHMYFSGFPFKDPPMPFEDEFLAICGIYILLRFLCIGWALNHGTREEIIDVVAAAFRLIDHTDFERYVANLLRKNGVADEKHLYRFMSL